MLRRLCGFGGLARCLPCGLMTIKSQADVERMCDYYGIDVDDALKISSFICWVTEYEMSSSGETALASTSIAQQQEVMASMSTRLYVIFVRCFILQLVNSIYHSANKTLFDDNRKSAALGYIKHVYSLISNEESDDLVEICCDCFEKISERWASFEETVTAEKEAESNQNSFTGKRRLSKTAEELGKTPSEDIAAQVSGIPKNLQNGFHVEPSHVKYRMAYGMMVGLETTVRVDAGLQLFTQHVLGMHAFRKELEKQMQEQGYPFCCDSFYSKPQTEGSEMSVDLIDFVLSTTSLRYHLPSEGTWFSPKHIMGNSADLWFDDLAPAMFARIREFCGIDSRDYLKSVACRGFSYIEFQTNSKSGEIFFFSHDGKFLLKTISNKEARQLLQMLPEYVVHVQSGRSILMRICGLHRFSSGTGQKVRHFLVAMSVFHTGDLGLHHQYDLKGSLHGREAREGEQVKKDRDWIGDNNILNLPVELKRSLASIVEADINFLAKQQVLDYSVLVGIHDRQSPTQGRRYQSVKLLTSMLRTKIMPIIRKARQLKKSESEMSLASLVSDVDHEGTQKSLTAGITGPVSPTSSSSRHVVSSDEFSKAGSLGSQGGVSEISADPAEAEKLRATAPASADTSTADGVADTQWCEVVQAAPAQEDQVSSKTPNAGALLNPFLEDENEGSHTSLGQGAETPARPAAQEDKDQITIEEQDPEYTRVSGPECNDTEESKAPVGVFFSPSSLLDLGDGEAKSAETASAQPTVEAIASAGSSFSVDSQPSTPKAGEQYIAPKKNNIYGKKRNLASARNLARDGLAANGNQPIKYLSSDISEIDVRAEEPAPGDKFTMVPATHHAQPCEEPQKPLALEKELTDLRSLDSKGQMAGPPPSPALERELSDLNALSSRGEKVESPPTPSSGPRRDVDMRRLAARNLQTKLNPRKDSVVSDGGVSVSSTNSLKSSKTPKPEKMPNFNAPGWDHMLKSPNGPICGTTMDLQGSSRYIYFMGIIDFLTPWDSKKRAEFALNKGKGRASTASCMPPDMYAKRQLDFFTRKVLGMYNLTSASEQQAYGGCPASLTKRGKDAK